MDFKDCVILKEISETLNITKTANHLFLSQPSLTYRIQNLEKELGVPIIARFYQYIPAN